MNVSNYNTDSQNENFFFLHEQIFNFLKGHDLLVTNRPKKKFTSYVVFVGGVKICFLSLEEATAKMGYAFWVKLIIFKSLQIQDNCGKISSKPDE